MRLNEAIILQPTEESIQLDEALLGDVAAVMLAEGFGSSVVKVLTTLTGGIVGGGAGYIGGVAAGAFTVVGLTQLTTYLALANPYAIPAVVGGAVTFGTLGYLLYKGVTVGLRAGEYLTTPSSAKAVAKVVKVTHERDDVLKLMKLPEDAVKYAKKLDDLTSKQIKYAKEADKSVEYDLKRKVLDPAEYSNLKAILNVASDGKLTYIK